MNKCDSSCSVECRLYIFVHAFVCFSCLSFCSSDSFDPQRSKKTWHEQNYHQTEHSWTLGLHIINSSSLTATAMHKITLGSLCMTWFTRTTFAFKWHCLSMSQAFIVHFTWRLYWSKKSTVSVGDSLDWMQWSLVLIYKYFIYWLPSYQIWPLKLAKEA